MWYCRAQKEFAFEITSRVVSTKRCLLFLIIALYIQDRSQICGSPCVYTYIYEYCIRAEIHGQYLSNFHALLLKLFLQKRKSLNHTRPCKNGKVFRHAFKSFIEQLMFAQTLYEADVLKVHCTFMYILAVIEILSRILIWIDPSKWYHRPWKMRMYNL